MIHFRHSLRFLGLDSQTASRKGRRTRSICASRGERGASVCLARKGILAHLRTHFLYSQSRGEILTLPELLALESA